VGTNINISRERGNQSEPAIAIDPTNPLRLFAASNENDLPPVAGFPITPGMFAGYSTNGGATWTTRIIANARDGIAPGFSDPWLAWDEFGNLFFSYIATNLGGAIALSTDGGVSFRAIATFAPSPGGLLDQPKVAAGAGMVWISYTDVGVSLFAAGAPVTGLGRVGSFSPPERVSSGLFGNFGNIAIGPRGQVIVAFQDSRSRTGPNDIHVAVEPNGRAPEGFGIAYLANNTKVGGFRQIPAQSVRTIDANARLTYDRSGGPHTGRVFLTYTDAPDIFSNATDIFERFSDDDGQTWSLPIRVTDDASGRSHFFPSIAVDQTTGNVAVAWYDCRNDPGAGPGDTDFRPNDDVEVFATVSFDGGVTFLPNVQVASGPSNSTVIPGFNSGNQFGDYMGLAFHAGRFYPAWVDNNRSLAGNPDLPNFDIATAMVQVVTGTPGPFVLRPPDRFEPNDTSDTATRLPGIGTFAGLSITRHADGLFDNDWFRLTAPSNSITVTINYTTFDGGDLHLRVFTLDSTGTLLQIGASLATGVRTQRVTASIARGQPVLIWVYGFNHSEGNYDLIIS
jgi:hypothetical protein